MEINLIEENHHQHEAGSKWSPLFEDGPGPDNVTARIGSTVQLDCKIQLLYDKTVCKLQIIHLAHFTVSAYYFELVKFKINCFFFQSFFIKSIQLKCVHINI